MTTSDELPRLKFELRVARQHASRTDAELAKMEANFHTAKADAARANARAARTHAEGVAANAALSEVRRLCAMTIDGSVRVAAVDQARDTLAVIDSVMETTTFPGDAAWHSVWLHGDWRFLTKQMATTEREHAADAVARYDAYLATQDSDPDHVGEPDGLRWWRDDR